MSKKNSGSYNTPKIKSSSLLPQVFNTDVNKKWLDSTLDQKISKGSLNFFRYKTIGLIEILLAYF